MGCEPQEWRASRLMGANGTHGEDIWATSSCYSLEEFTNILSEALPDDCKHMGYKCLDVSQVKRSFLSFVFPFSFPGHIRCPTFVFCLHIYNSHLLFLVWHILLLSASVFFLLSPLKMFDCFDPITSLTLFELSSCEFKACTHS